MKNQYPTFSMDAVRGADLNSATQGGVRHSVAPERVQRRAASSEIHK